MLSAFAVSDGITAQIKIFNDLDGKKMKLSSAEEALCTPPGNAGAATIRTPTCNAESMTTGHVSQLHEIRDTSVEIEGLLSDLGAEGDGLGQKARDLGEELPQSVRNALRQVGFFRNRIMHEGGDLSNEEMRQFRVASDRSIEWLSQELERKALAKRNRSIAKKQRIHKKVTADQLNKTNRQKGKIRSTPTAQRGRKSIQQKEQKGVLDSTLDFTASALNSFEKGIKFIVLSFVLISVTYVFISLLNFSVR